jgi:hypothetical protein
VLDPQLQIQRTVQKKSEGQKKGGETEKAAHLAGYVQRHVRAQVHVRVLQLGDDPVGQFGPLVVPLVPLVRKDHHAVVRFGPDYAPHALGGLADRVEGEEVVLLDLEGVPQVL